MGQRGKSAAFMPGKFVFPGGAIDRGDADIALSGHPNPTCVARLKHRGNGTSVDAVLAAAIRELWEETGLILGRKGAWNDPPTDWAGFAKSGMVPDASALHFFFRAVTPPGRPRRFDARFLIADADAIANDPDDFSHASDELSHLQWVALDQVRQFDLPFITKVVMAELDVDDPVRTPKDGVPFVTNDDPISSITRIL